MVSSIISSVFKQESKLKLQSTSLRPGQIFNGKILKLFPNQTAEVQIGNQKMIAQLDIPLQAGSRYWLQVQSGDGKISLKVLNDSSGVSVNQDGLEAVLRAFGLSVSKENLEILPFFLKEQLPVNKEILQQTANWLKNTEHPEQGLNTVKWMISQGYPMKKEIFQSLVSMQSQTPISNLMKDLFEQLNRDSSKSDIATTLKKVLTSFIMKESKQAGEKILQTLVNKWLKNEDEGVPFSILKKLGVLPLQTNENRSEVTKENSLPVGWINKEQGLHEELANRQIGQNRQIHSHEIEQILKTLNLQENEIAILPTKLVELSKQSHLTNEKQFLENLMLVTEINPSSYENSDPLHPILKKLIHSLGLQYEKDVYDHFNGFEDDSIKQDSLKSLLIQYINEESKITDKKPAEHLLQRITGMQLLSKEMGPLLQVVMQIPIPLWNSVPELTLQWSGRKTEDGKIDPNFCRVLFYLELENLKETLVDLKIQNRIVSIKIINDHDEWLQNLKPLQNFLKENLKGLNYQLSSLQFEKAYMEQIGKDKITIVPAIYQHQSYSGVDIKI